MSEKKQTSGTEKEIPTDGIDIVPWTVASEDGTEVTYSTWDFAGQAVYYNTHQVSWGGWGRWGGGIAITVAVWDSTDFRYST